jgi:hypothetical protein
MTDYPRLPEPPARHQGEPVDLYGARLFQWLLTDDASTATMSDDQLELAGYAAIGVSARTTDPHLADVFSRVRHVIARMLTNRAELRALVASDAAIAAPAVSATPQSDRPNEGPMAPLAPRPRTNPPAPSYAIERYDNVQF